MDNLIVNPMFTKQVTGQNGTKWVKSLDGWTITGKPWVVGHKLSNPSEPGFMAAEMDQDRPGGIPRGWFDGDEGSLSQIVQAPNPHTIVKTYWDEVHHIYQSICKVTLSGKEGDDWVELWHRDGLTRPPVTPENHNVWPPMLTPEELGSVITSSHPAYKWEYYGKYVDPNNEGKEGVKITNIFLGVE